MPGGVQFFLNTADQPGIMAGADPDWQLKAQRVAAGDAFKDGVPRRPDGSLDTDAMTVRLFQKGDFGSANNLMQAGISQQLLKAAQSPSDVLGGGSPVAAPPTSPPTGGAYPIFQNAIAGIESGGRYDAQGPVTKTGDRAYGKYQVMGANIPSWTKEFLGTEMTPEQFLGDQKAQDTVFNGKFGQYLKQTGNPRDAASMWFTGKPFAQGADAHDQLGTTGSAYVSKFLAALPRGSQAVAQSPSSGPLGAPTEVAQNGTSDAPPPSTTHPYAPPTPPRQADQGTPPRIAPAAGSAQPGQAPVALAGTTRPGQAPSPGPAGMPMPPAQSAPLATRPNTPYASNGSNFVDPTLGGLVSPEQLQKYGSYGGVAKAAAAEAATLSVNPYAKGKAEALMAYAKEIMSTVSKAQELTPAQKIARDPIALKAQEDLAIARGRARADAEADNALVPVVQADGATTLMPKRVAMAKAAQGDAVLHSLPGYVTSGQKNLQDKLDTGSAAYQERQIAGERLDALSNLLSTYQTGANSTAFNNAAAKLRSFGIAVPDGAMVNPAAMQEFAKNSYANVLSSMREQGNKQFVAEVQSAINSNPSTDLQPEANAAMVAQMRGIQQYHDQNFRDYADWYEKNRGASNDAKFQIDWAKKNPVEPYVATARRDIAPMGVPLPPKNKLVDGQMYLVRGQKARWSASAGGFIPEAQR